MKRMVFTLLAVSVVLVIGMTWYRGARAMNLKLHAKDLPEHGLKIITPADPSFDGRARALSKGRADNVMDSLKPFSIILENRGSQTAVAYMLEWCFTKADGQDECYRHAYSSPLALMEGEPPVPEDREEQSNHIKPNKARLFSLVSPDGPSQFRVPVSREEAEQIKAGASVNREALLQRYNAELAKYTDITVSIDGVFFDDGTFVGPDTTGFFAIMKAEVAAKHDLLQEMALGLSKLNKSKEEVFGHVEKVANGPDVDIGSNSTPTDFYNFYRKYYANEVLRMRQVLGDDKSLAAALHPLKQPWVKVRKKEREK